MIRRMEHLQDGTYEPFVPRLIVTPDRVEVSLLQHEDHTFTIDVGTEEDSRIRGRISTDDPRLSAEDDYFQGTSCVLTCHIDTRGLLPGDSVSGYVVVTTSVGEKTIPVHADVVEMPEKQLPEDIRYLEDFTEKAKEDYEEAFRFFTGGRFMRLLKGEHASLRPLYLGLAQNPVTRQRMEEFLVAADQKERVTLSAEHHEFSFYDLKEPTREDLRIRRSGWGYLNYRIDVHGDFLEVSKKWLTEDDFVGSTFDLNYVIHGEMLGKGRQEGTITLTSPDEACVFRIYASRRSAHGNNEARALKKAKLRLGLSYRDFRLNKMDTKTWGVKTLTTVSAMREMGCDEAALTLYEAYVCYVTGDSGSAKRLVRSLQNHDFKQEAYEVKAGFLYMCHVCGLLTPGSIDVVARLRDWHNRSRESMVMLFILMQVDEDLKRTPRKALLLMEEVFESGSAEPLLYLEALSLLLWRPDLLRSLNEFTVRVLSYGRRFGLLTEELYKRAAILADNERSFRKSVYNILAEGYDKTGSKDILSSICRLIIKGQPRRKEYFKWYELAVEEDVRLTRVYEYYIETIPDTYQKKLPLKVRKYFLMSSGVGRDRLAFMYANILKHREEDPNSYQAFLEQMQVFTGKALMDGLINRDYAMLYKNFYPTVEDRVVGEALAQVCFTARIYCQDKRMKEVAVCHEELAYEAVTRLNNGVAYVNIYTPNYRILFCDEKGGRYAADVSYSFEMLMNGDELTKDCLRLRSGDLGTDLHAYAGMEYGKKVTEENLEAYFRLSDHDAVAPSCKKEIRRRMLAYFQSNLSSEHIDEYLERINYIRFARTDKVALTEILIVRGYWERAYELIRRFGCEKINPSAMLHMISQKIRTNNGEKDEALLQMAAYVYDHRKYDEAVLTYLMANVETSFEKLIAIRADAAAFYLDTYDLDEKIIKRAMFIQKPLPEGCHILEQYRREGGREEICSAYLKFVAAFYLIDGCSLDRYEQHLMLEAYDKGWLEGDTCRLALLKALSTKETLNFREDQSAENILDEMLAKGIRLGFFRKLPAGLLAGSGIPDRVFVETAAREGDRVTLYYRMEDGKSSGKPYQSEPMTMVSSNIYSREFVLFYGETLHYYMTVEHRGRLIKTPEKTRTMKSADMTGRSACQLINQMLSAHRLGKTELRDEKIREYQKAMAVCGMLFKLQEET